MANSKRRCRHCRKYKPAADGVLIQGGFYCNVDHAIAWANAKKEREQQKAREWSRSLPKSKREFNKLDITWQKDRTQEVFNRMRVLQEFKWFRDRDIEPYCISCQKTHMDWCCSHYKSRGSNTRLRYDERNTYLACNRYCNKGLSGNIGGTPTSIGYTEGIKARFGQEEGQAILDYLETTNAPISWEWWELQEMRKQFSAEHRRLKKELGVE